MVGVQDFNPCVDCRSMMFNAAEKHMEEIGAEFIISGEVLGQRPMSQHAPALRTIEKEIGFSRKNCKTIISCITYQKQTLKRDGLIKRENLGMIKGTN